MKATTPVLMLTSWFGGSYIHDRRPAICGEFVSKLLDTPAVLPKEVTVTVSDEPVAGGYPVVIFVDDLDGHGVYWIDNSEGQGSSRWCMFYWMLRWLLDSGLVRQEPGYRVKLWVTAKAKALNDVDVNPSGRAPSNWAYCR